MSKLAKMAILDIIGGMTVAEADFTSLIDRHKLRGTGVDHALEALPAISATELKSQIANVFRNLGPHQAVAVTNHCQLKGVIVGIDEYIELLRLRKTLLGNLEEEFDRKFSAMQTPNAARAVDDLFSAASIELGAAALEAAR